MTLWSTRTLSAHAEMPTPLCIAQLTKKPYLSQESAQDVCLTYPYTALGCAMDLVDMQYSENYFDALEYCLAPSGRP